jgi:hypothetical protein
VPSEGTGRLLFLSQVVWCLPLALGTIQCGNRASYNLLPAITLFLNDTVYCEHIMTASEAGVFTT